MGNDDVSSTSAAWTAILSFASVRTASRSASWSSVVRNRSKLMLCFLAAGRGGPGGRRGGRCVSSRRVVAVVVVGVVGAGVGCVSPRRVVVVGPVTAGRSVRVEAAAGLAAEQAGVDHPVEQRRRC